MLRILKLEILRIYFQIRATDKNNESLFTEAELEIHLTDENDNIPKFEEDVYKLNVTEDLSSLEEDENGHYLGKHIQIFFSLTYFQRKIHFMKEKVCKNLMTQASQFFA